MDWDLPVYRLDSFISSCTDDDFTEYTLGQATDWFIHTADASLEHLVDHTIKTCPKKFCRSLKWEGNPDVSGIGVYAAFMVQAALATLFLLFYIRFYVKDVVDVNKPEEEPTLPKQLQGNDSPTDPQPTSQQHDDQPAAQKATKLFDPIAFRETADNCLEVFWATCYVFAFTFVIAAVVFITDHDNDSTGRVYSGYFTYLGAVNSIAVLICLWPWFPGRHKYPVLTFSGLTVLLCMMAGVSIAFFRISLGENKTTFEARCLGTVHSAQSVQKLVKGTPYAVLALIVLWGGSLLVIRIRTPKMTDKGNDTVLTLYLVLTGIFGGFLVLTSFVLVWLSLGFFHSLRQHAENLSGLSYAENEWGFGQVAAIVAWVPVFGQFSAIVIRGLARLLPVGARELFEPVPKDQRGTARVLARALRNRKHQHTQRHESMTAEAVPLSSLRSISHDEEDVGTTSAGAGSHAQ
ncbi:hypothetical protein NEUTE1DRAFT_85234 [Neurospora tetrasperma FGSC 2508]|uniref:Uncharacterized protein n=1 Tax=Neurospora tetrasperma (strain FGSC 2508 / ATCC MYA-4615 / P0657) TaxID=510951 RepID=F8MSV6_NEUT8|nr:uncharacterized protein NEUTE1DRAFT_85234 [Neurospora tetrasperma FGSC 2508]EGO55139.1 hypothetical protein NEUTE1DRAFT_85234 [Neurospora tetrasperma FGSC 2508]